MKFFKHSRKGFTLVELVVVIAVVAILTGVSVGSYFGVMDSAKKSNALVNQKQVSDALLLYKIKNSASNDSRSMEEIAIDITTNYLVENECSNTNFVVGTLKLSTTVSNKVHINKEASETTLKETIIFYVEETSNSYGSYLIYDYNDNGKILYTSSNDIKSTSDFQKNIKTNSDVANILSSDTINEVSTIDSDELFPVTTIDGNRVVPFFKINFSGNSYYLRNGKKLSDIDEASITYEDIKLGDYSFTRKINLVDENNSSKQITKDYVFSNKNYTSEKSYMGENGKFVYKTFTLDIKTDGNDEDSIISNTSFIVIEQNTDEKYNYSLSKDIKLFDNQDLLSNYLESYNKTLNNETLPILSYIFVNNYTFTKNITIPSNYVLVCDYEFSWNYMVNFIDSYKFLYETNRTEDDSKLLSQISTNTYGSGDLKSGWLEQSNASFLVD